MKEITKWLKLAKITEKMYFLDFFSNFLKYIQKIGLKN